MSSSENHDELISQFLAFTGSADPDKASSYLEMSGYNVETAVGLYLEHETGGGGGGEYVDPSAGGGRSRAARSVAEGPPLGDDGEVRAPDSTRTMRLMDDDTHGGGMMMMNPAYQLMSAMMDMDEAPPSSAFASTAAALTTLNARAALDAAIARQGGRDMDLDDEEKENYEEDDDDNEDEYDARHMVEPPRLADMFAAPEHLMHRAGGFLGARTMAKDSKRWLLVNVQRDSVFASHALNRDVWRDELVENLIREGFIFWQQVCFFGSTADKKVCILIDRPETFHSLLLV
jgi:UBX domain-containing protein 7